MFGVIAVLFILMGLAPLIFELRAGPRRIVIGKTNLQGVRFRDREGAPRTFYAFGRDDPGETVAGDSRRLAARPRRLDRIDRRSASGSASWSVRWPAA